MRKLGRTDYLVGIGAGAGAGAALGQQEAAKREATATRMASLMVFMMVGYVWLFSTYGCFRWSNRKWVPESVRTLAGSRWEASIDCASAAAFIRLSGKLRRMVGGTCNRVVRGWVGS